jgi:hypothetical protein
MQNPFANSLQTKRYIAVEQFTLVKNHQILVWIWFIGATLGVSGRREAKEVEVEGTKTRAERNEKGSPTHLNHRPRHILF